MSGKAIKTWTSFHKPVYERVHVFQRGTRLSLRAVRKIVFKVPMPVVTLWEYGKGHGGSRRDKAIPETPILSAFPGFYPLLELGVFFVALNCICLSFIQIHTYFYFNYIIYNGLLIFCCQNVATHLL